MEPFSLVDAMIGLITAAFYTIIFAVAFIFGFRETATTTQWLGLD